MLSSSFSSNALPSSVPPHIVSWIDSIQTIDSRILVEESRRWRNTTTLTVKILLRRCDDLILDKDLKLEILIGFNEISSSSQPERSFIGRIRIFITDSSDHQFFSNEFIRSNDADPEALFPTEIVLPWLDLTSFTQHASLYPLAVWLFCVRALLKNPLLPPYHCNVLLHKEIRGYCRGDLLPSTTSAIPLGDTTLHFGTAKSKGRRNYMEDVDFIYEKIKISEKEMVTIFGVLDGHGGSDCAQYVADDIPSKITALLRNRGAREANSIAEGLYQTFREIDLDYLRTCAESNAGSTACILLLHHRQNTLSIANTGDTRAVLSHNNIALNLSYDRKASDPEEIARIVCNGGFVKGGRVQGILAVSRAFGDSQLKRPRISQSGKSLSSNSESNGILVCDPEISLFSPIIQDEFIIVATDGLWDVMTSQDAVNFVVEQCKKEFIDLPIQKQTGVAMGSLKVKLDKIASALVTHATERLQTADNITVMIAIVEATGLSREVSLLGENSLSSKYPHLAAFAQKSSNNVGLSSEVNKKLESNYSDPFHSSSLRSQQTAVPGNGNICERSKPRADEDDFMDFLLDDKNFLT